MNAIIRKQNTRDWLRLSLSLYHQSVTLTLDKNQCLKCDICSLVCPRGAVRVTTEEGVLDIDIDRRKCLMCELCSYFCPARAVTLTINDGAKTILGDQHAVSPPPAGPFIEPARCSYGCLATGGDEPHWCRRERQWVENRYESCPKSCLNCMENCKRDAFRVEGLEVEADPLACLHCMSCLLGCPQEAVRVEPYFTGRVEIDPDLCPEDCTFCMDVCPAGAILRVKGIVTVVKDVCLLCGACKNVCTWGAVKVQRDWVIGEPASPSRAWQDASQRLKAGDVR